MDSSCLASAKEILLTDGKCCRPRTTNASVVSAQQKRPPLPRASDSEDWKDFSLGKKRRKCGAEILCNGEKPDSTAAATSALMR